MIGKKVRTTVQGLSALNKADSEMVGNYDEGTLCTIVLALPAEGENEQIWYAAEPDGKPDVYIPVREDMIEEVVD